MAETTTRPVAGAPGFTITRHLEGHAYPANGNVHNPTPRYSYTLQLDGQLVDRSQTKGPLVREAQQPGARERYVS